jgi:hypothetical protein
MATKLAAGLVVFRRISNSVQYLLLQTSYGEKHWTPPKGRFSGFKPLFNGLIEPEIPFKIISS